MLFNSFSFIFLFLPVALLGFFATSRMGRGSGAIWLMLVSFVFYGLWNPRFVVLLLVSIAFNFSMGEAIHAARLRPGRQKLLLTLGIGADLLLLGYYKYFFSLLGFAAASGLTRFHVPPILLPLGISFFTFTQIGYLADVQQGVVKDRGLFNYVLFVTFFPHLIAGPILHNGEIMPQFAKAENYRFSIENFTAGVVIFTIGLAKKCLLADPIADRVHEGFATAPHLPLLAAWFTALIYSLQLYFDFSGYTDMAIGIARMFNIRFPLNFNSPLKATSIIDYWHRWHMTLSRFLNLYLFNPIALAVMRRRMARGKPVNKAAQRQPAGFMGMVAMPLLVTMGLAGIWHGAGVQFLIFGLLHGFYLSVNHAWRIARPAAASGPLAKAGSFLLTLAAVLVALVFFRSANLPNAMAMLAGMVGLHGVGLSAPSLAGIQQVGTGLPTGVAFLKMANLWAKDLLSSAWILVLCVIVWAMPNTQEIMGRYQLAPADMVRTALLWRPTLGWAAATGAVGAVALLAISGTTEFLYYQF